MKYVIGTAGIVGVLSFAMAAWSVAGKLMTEKNDISVMMGLGIVGLLVGLMAAGVAACVRRVFKSMGAAASVGQSSKDEKVCR
jgi:hypothetical protein